MALSRMRVAQIGIVHLRLRVANTSCLFLQNLNPAQAAPVRRPLADLTNVRPLQLGSPIKRSKSDPLPAAAAIPPVNG